MKNTKKITYLSATSCAAGGISKAFFWLILVFLPYYMEPTFYTNLIEGKAHAYWIIAGIMTVGIIVTVLMSLIRKEDIIDRESRINSFDIAMLAFGISILISFILCKEKWNAFLGSTGFWVGTMTLLSLIICYFFVSRCLYGGRELWDMVLIMNYILFAWVICNAISIDIMGMHEKIIDAQYFDYYASLGQMDSVSSYLCLLLPIILVLYLDEQDKEYQWMHRIFLLLGLAAMTGIRTDGVYIGISFCALFLFPFIFDQKERIERLLHVGMIWGIAITFYSVINVIDSSKLSSADGVSCVLIKYWIGAVMIVACLILLAVYKRWNEKISQKFLKGGKFITVVSVALIITIFIIHSILNFEVGWGNGRGGIWEGSMQMYADYNFVEKLFGCGTEVLTERLTGYVTAINHWKDVNVANCHNDFLQYLLALGLVGFIAYTSIWIIAIREFFRRKKDSWSILKAAYFMGMMAYVGQSFVGNPYSLSVPILFLVMALFRNASMKNSLR